MTNRYLIPSTTYSETPGGIPPRLIAFLELTQSAAQGILGLHEQLQEQQQKTQNISALRLSQLTGLFFTDDPTLIVNVGRTCRAEFNFDEYHVKWYQMPINEVLVSRQGILWTANDSAQHPSFILQTEIFPLEAIQQIANDTMVYHGNLTPLPLNPAFILQDRNTQH